MTTPQRLDYRRLNHSRMTEEMERRLEQMPTAFLVLSRLRRLVGDGRSITLEGGVRGWAEWLGCARGYPKVILAKLVECGFATITYGERGSGTVTITVMPPRELRSTVDHNDHDPHISDPVAAGRARPANENNALPSDHPMIDQASNPDSAHQHAQNADSARSTIDQPILYESCMQQQQNSQPESAQPDLPAATRAALVALNASDDEIQAIAEVIPSLTVAQLRAEIAKAESRPGVHTPVGLALFALANNSRVTAARKPPERGKPRQQQRNPRASPARERFNASASASDERPIDTQRFTSGEYAGLFQSGGDTSDLPQHFGDGAPSFAGQERTVGESAQTFGDYTPNLPSADEIQARQKGGKPWTNRT